MVQGESSGSIVLINNFDVGNPLHMNPNDSTSITLIPFKLLGTKNYRIWPSAMKLNLQARNKFVFVVGSCVKSAFATSDGLVYFVDVASVWKELESTYDKVDGSVIFNLLQKITSIKQGGSFMADYYHRLNSLWREFDALTNLTTCTCDANKELGLHSQLMKDPLPEVKDAYTTVSREESYRGIPQPFSVTESKINATFLLLKGLM
ncbi:ribonuclease H-like domain-containing protein [Tanacetum coccineum]